MVNMLKVSAAILVLLLIIGIAMLGKRIRRVLIFRSATTINNESKYIEIITGLLAIIIIISDYASKKPDTIWYMWLGQLIFFLGGLMQLFARKALGEEKTLQEGMKSEFNAAQTGLYKRLRYPSKTALLLMLLGLGIATQSVWGIIITVVIFFPAMLFRISAEEQKMQDDFSDRWITYKSETKRIIPGIL